MLIIIYIFIKFLVKDIKYVILSKAKQKTKHISFIFMLKFPSYLKIYSEYGKTNYRPLKGEGNESDTSSY